MIMEKLLQIFLFPIFILVSGFIFGPHVDAVPYDYNVTIECVAKPLNSQYGGGIIVNPELNDGLKGWRQFGVVNIENRQSKDGNKYIVATNRNQTFHSFSQKFNVEKGKIYTFSAWLQVNIGEVDIAAIFKTRTGYETAGWVTARKGCWSMLKGGLVVNASGPAELYFETKVSETQIEIWGDSFSLQPFSEEEWTSHQNESLEKYRKGRVKIQVVDDMGRPISNAKIHLRQVRSNFPLGCAINKNILSSKPYQNWFTSRFKYTAFENELKWYATESSRGFENYGVSDAMVQFAKSHGVAIRGHNVFWDDPKFQPSWVGGLSVADLRAAASKRISSVMKRYQGQFFHWDVVNENLHFSFFESKLGWDASSVYYKLAHYIDPRTTPFLNDYNTIEESKDMLSLPSKYLGKINQIRSQGYNGPLGIGLEGHFSYANVAYIRSSIDWLASAKLPIWITELDVTSGPNQASYLNTILWELVSHRAVQGVIIWSAWSPQGCYRVCLTDNNFRNLPTGDVVDRIRAQLAQQNGINGSTDANGFFEASLFHGDYEAQIISANGKKLLPFDVKAEEEGPKLVLAKFDDA